MILGWQNGVREMSSDLFGRRSARTDEDGRYAIWQPPGNYYLRVTSPDGSFSQVYYPSVGYPEDAVPWNVGGGIDLDGIDIVLPRNELFRLTFRFSVPEYLPGVPEPLSSYLDGNLPVQAWVRPLGRGVIGSAPFQISLSLLEDGSYITGPLSAGEYELWLTYWIRLWPTLGGIPEWDVDRVASLRSDLDPIARLRITLNSRDSEDANVDLGTIQESAKTLVPGRLTFRTARGSTVDPAVFAELSFRDTVFAGIATSGRQTGVSTDGTFAVRLHSGLFRFAAPSSMPNGHYVASVRSGARDVLNEGLLVGGGPVNPIEIVIADDPARIEGVARHGSGALAPDALIVLIPPAGRRGPLSRFPVAQADSSGVFVLDNVPPGEYRLLALDLAGLPQPVPEAPDFLREFELRGERITLDPGARTAINLEALPFGN
jgi:hypothetical protein